MNPYTSTGAVTERGGAAASARTGSDVLTAGRGGGPAALSARATGTAAAAETEKRTEETETRTNPLGTKVCHLISLSFLSEK